MEAFLEFAKTFGVPMALVAVFVARDFVREKVLTQRVQKIEDFNTETLVGLVVSVRQITAQAAEALRDNTALLRRVNGRLRDATGQEPYEERHGMES